MPWPEPFEPALSMTSHARVTAPGRQARPSRPVRLALVTSSLRLGGAEKQTAYIARALFQTGMYLRLFHLGTGGAYEPVLQKQGIPITRIYFANRPSLILVKLIGALRQWRPQVVLATQFGDLRYAAPAGRLCHALTLGGIRSDGWQDVQEYGALSRWMIRLSHGLLANSYRARQNLVTQGIPANRIEVVPNRIDLAEFDSLSASKLALPLPQGRVIAAAVGSLHSCKRFDRFLEALALARRSQPALAGILAGTDRGQRSALEAKARSLNLEPPNLIFAGECANIPALLSRAELLVLCSEYEGFPNVILEAMAAKLPVITTPAGDAARIVKHCQTGYVVNGENRAKMAELMAQLAQSPELRTRLGEAGRQRVQKEYSYDSLGADLLESLRGFAGKQGRSILAGKLRTAVAADEGERSRPLHLQISNA